MAMDVYQGILNQAQRLPLAEQIRLLEELAVSIRGQIACEPRRSVLDLQGLGKEIWLAVDVKQYIDRERDSWNG